MKKYENMLVKHVFNNENVNSNSSNFNEKAIYLIKCDKYDFDNNMYILKFLDIKTKTFVRLDYLKSADQTERILTFYSDCSSNNSNEHDRVYIFEILNTIDLVKTAMNDINNDSDKKIGLIK